MNEWLRFLTAALATWRVTHLIVYEDGPWDVIARLRRRAGSGFFGKLMDCFYCSSLWVAAAAALAVAPDPKDWPLLWLALSGAVCLLQRIDQQPVVVERLGENQGETEDALLRTESGEGAGGGNGAR
jgi:Protein of unknown function (DUF1360)